MSSESGLETDTITRGVHAVEVSPTIGQTMPQAPLPADVTDPIGHIDAFMERYIGEAVESPELADAIRYALLAPGKRLRPLLVWHSASAAGAEPADALPAAAAVELVHAFSLVHDDLPGMDDDDLRRGRPTLHRQTSEGMAILAGDAMLTLAFACITDRVPDGLRAAQLTAEIAAGTGAMITGQVFDTFGTNHNQEPAERLEQIHRNKTGALIRASCRMGALFADDPHSCIDALSEYGEVIGLMFQIVDDLLDVTQTTEHLGKRANKDIEAGKLTYPGVHGVEKSRARVRELHERTINTLRNMGDRAEPLRALASYMAVRTR